VIFAKQIDGVPVKVTRREVKQFVNDPVFGFFLEVYQYTKLWGMPNGNGWANEPLSVLEGITALEMEIKSIEAEELNAGTERTSSSTVPR
jgi:hypothetical protein